MKRRAVITCALCVLVLGAAAGWAQDRFPRPEFTTSYTLPSPTTPMGREGWYAIADVATLAVTLALAGVMALKRRSRRELALLALLAVVYFGFFRRGCVCSVGAIQNVTYASCDNAYTVSLSTLCFFALPLLFALAFGRVFCAAVCPLGAIQDLVLWKPVRVPTRLAAALSLVPILFLGTTVVLAACGAGYVTCRLDPFIGFFRLNGPTIMLGAGVVILLVGVVVGRPYCRFFCPYGVLLGWCSKVSWKHASITPDDCVQCRLCEESCPFDAIRMPSQDGGREDAARALGRTRWVLPLLIVFLVLGGTAGVMLSGAFGHMHRTTALARQIRMEQADPSLPMTLESEAFRSAGESERHLFEQARRVHRRLRLVGAVAGVIVGFAVWSRLFGFGRFRRSDRYEPDPEFCLSCGRCFRACPREEARLKGIRRVRETDA